MLEDVTVLLLHSSYFALNAAVHIFLATMILLRSNLPTSNAMKARSTYGFAVKGIYKVPLDLASFTC